jgi:hypothetical protein
MPGNIVIIKHNINRKSVGVRSGTELVLEYEVKNISDNIIGSALFEIALYDAEKHQLDKIEQKTFALKPGIVRKLNIGYSGVEADNVSGYEIRVKGILLPLAPVTVDNNMLKILNHEPFRAGGFSRISECGVSISVRNITEETIASAVFEIAFFDIEGTKLHSMKHKELEIPPTTSRRVIINCPGSFSDVFNSYSIKIIKVNTAAVEKVILLKKEIRKIGEREDVQGLVKNISNVNTDAALVVTFQDYKDEIIGCKVIIIRRINSGDTRQFHFLFKPQEGEVVKRCNLDVICDMDELS